MDNKTDTTTGAVVSMSKGKLVAGTIGVIIVMFFVGYYFGNMHGTSSAKASRTASGYGARGGAAGGAGRFASGTGATVGTILSQDANSITVKLASGGSKIVLIGDSTTVAKSVAGAISDLAVGDNVMVIGTSNSDGSMTATSVSIRPDSGSPAGAPGAAMQGAAPAAPSGN